MVNIWTPIPVNIWTPIDRLEAPGGTDQQFERTMYGGTSGNGASKVLIEPGVIGEVRFVNKLFDLAA